MTILLGIGCLIGAIFIFRRQLRQREWGANIRTAIATVIILWVPVEIMGRLNIFSEIWVVPQEHKTVMFTLLGIFVVLAIYLWVMAYRKRRNRNAAEGGTRQ